ncbi:uncharacterized protein LOC120347977 [Styela clava]
MPWEGYDSDSPGSSTRYYQRYQQNNRRHGRAARREGCARRFYRETRRCHEQQCGSRRVEQTNTWNSEQTTPKAICSGSDSETIPKSICGRSSSSMSCSSRSNKRHSDHDDASVTALKTPYEGSNSGALSSWRNRPVCRRSEVHPSFTSPKEINNHENEQSSTDTESSNVFQIHLDSFTFTDSGSDSENAESTNNRSRRRVRRRTNPKKIVNSRCGGQSCCSNCPSTHVPLKKFDIESQTSPTLKRERMIQTSVEILYDTEAQTDGACTRDRKSQTSLKTTDSDTQTCKEVVLKRKLCKQDSAFSDNSTQTSIKLSFEKDIQTVQNLRLSNHTQTTIKSVSTMEIQTESGFAATKSTQTDVSTKLGDTERNVAPCIDKSLQESFYILSQNDEESTSAKEFIKRYKEEEITISPAMKQKFLNMLPLILIVWKIIWNKLAISSFQRCHKDTENGAWAKMSYILASLRLKDLESHKGLLPYVSKLSDVMIMGKELTNNNKFFHATVAFYAAAKLHEVSGNGDKAICGIRECVHGLRLISKSLIRYTQSKNIVRNHLIPFMYDMIEFQKPIPGSTHKVRIEMEACSLFCTALAYYFCGDHEHYVSVNENAIDLMKREFGEEVLGHHVYGLCYLNVGVGYERMEKFKEAVERYRKALEIYRTALDWGSKKEKKKIIVLTTNDLEIAKKKVDRVA